MMVWTILAGLIGCGAEGVECEECGAPTTCAVPFCTEDGACDPGYLTLELRDDVDGDCMAPVCPGDAEEPVSVADDTDLPEDTACGIATCDDGAAGVDVVARGEACRIGAGFCTGEDETAASCVECIDDQVALYATDVGCTPERNRCDAETNSCVGDTTWDTSFGELAFSADGREVSRGSLPNVYAFGNNARSSLGVNEGTYYWELEVISGVASQNDGGVGIMRSDESGDNYLGNVYYGSSGGFSFGYGTPSSLFYYNNFSGSVVNGVPPESSRATVGTVYMFALDMDNQRLWVGHNGNWHNGGSPSTGQNPTLEGLSGTIHAGVTLYNARSLTLRGNFMGPFDYQVPSGFQAGLY